MSGGSGTTQREHPGPVEAGYRAALESLERNGAIGKIAGRDPGLWTEDPAAARVIANRLGWLDSPVWGRERIPELGAFAERVRGLGVTRVLLLGMGGSSLAPEVFARVLGPGPGAPALHVLDSTVPAAVRTAESETRLDRTFFLVSSKSGKTLETLSQYRYFRARVTAAGVSDPAGRFAVITDPGSELDRLAASEGIPTVFRNPPDIGGRYSALSYFGLVPAALLGVRLDAVLGRALRERDACLAPGPGNAALRLGALLGAAARAGRDKLTILAPPSLRPLGFWIEQLVAESTGKSGTGIVPVEGEPPGTPAAYGRDRVFAVLGLADDPSPALDGLADEMQRAGSPVVTMTLEDRDSIAAAFYRWEVATAVAGAVLRINPFDEPNVQESKDNTARILSAPPAEGRAAAPRVRRDGVEVYAGDALWKRIGAGSPGEPDLDRVLRAFLALARPGDYLALLAYLERTAAAESAFDRLRRLIRDALRLPVLQGYGPRYLHSIGQLYKGGPPSGLFLILTRAHEADIDIPGAPYRFGDLNAAQAQGDLESLESHGKPALRLHLASGPDPGLSTLIAAAEHALVALTAGA
jgi:transaldolase/glucose-6-phosphate isomerase